MNAHLYLPASAPVPLDADGPAFEQPWQAQAFSLIVHLYQADRFAWKDWVEVFSQTIVAAPATEGESVNDAYYRQWLLAAERLVERLGLATPAAIGERAEAWRQAYLNTPHGQPVLLANASCPPAHDHGHDHAPWRTPVAVSPASR